jgi:hypothetical protein
VVLSREPLSPILPADVKIQSAARLGGLILAVWGTTTLTSDSSIVNILTMQLLRDTTLLGGQRRVTSVEARPFGYVQVIASGKLFFVVWNDLRNQQARAYLQRVDTTGQLVGGEELLSNDSIGPSGIVQLQTSVGYKWIWSTRRAADTAGAIEATSYVRTVDHEGNFAGEVEGPIAGNVRQILMPGLLPNIRVLHRGNLPPLLIDSTGRIDSVIGEAARHFTLPYYLDEADGSLVTLENRAVQYYRTLIDTMPYKELTVPIPTDIHEGSQSLTRDSSGRLSVLWATGGLGWSNGGKGSSLNPGYTYVMRTDRTDADTFTTPYVAKKLFIHLFIDSDTYTFYSSSERFEGCGNNYRITLGFYGHYIRRLYSDSVITRDFTIPVSYTVNAHGYIAGYAEQVAKPFLPLPRDCHPGIDPVIIRSPDDSVSKVLLVSGTDSIALVAHSAGSYANTVPQITPCITAVGSNLVVAWNSYGRDSVLIVGRWNPAIDSPATVTRTLRFDTILSSDDSVTSHIYSHQLEQIGDRYYYTTSHQWKARNAPGDSLVDHWQFNFYMPVDSGLHHSVSVLQDVSDADGRPFLSFLGRYDPDTRVTLFPLGIWNKAKDSTTVRLYMLNEEGDEIARYDDVLTVTDNQFTSFIPAGNGRYLQIVGFEAAERSGNDTIGTFRFPVPSGGSGLFYDRLRGAGILRTYWNGIYSSEAKDCSLEIFDLDGNLLRQNVVHLAANPVHFTYVQNPTDSGLALLYGGLAGVHLLLLDKHLNVVQPDTRISSSAGVVGYPSAAFRNDSLFVIWEDYSRGLADIHGIAFKAKTTSSVEVEHVDNRVQPVLALAPNPASDVTTLVFSENDATTITIVDSYGVVRMQLAAVTSHSTLDLRTLPTGVYRVVVKSKADSRSVPLVVVR